MVYLIAFIVILADQYTKALAVAKLQTASVPVIKDVFHLTYVENTGAAFGMFQNANAFFIVAISVILVAVIFAVIKYKPTQKLVKFAAALVIGGAIGNLIDRIFRGFVVDFFDFRVINYPVFNIADSCVVVGAILFAVFIIFFDKKEDESAAV